MEHGGYPPAGRLAAAVVAGGSVDSGNARDRGGASRPRFILEVVESTVQ
jgi:hypothetical protein